MSQSELLVLDPILALGFIGALTVIVGFVLNQLKIWNVNDFEYDFINLIGGGLLAAYAYHINSWPFLVLFSVWVAFSLKDCISDYRHRFDWKKSGKRKKK